MTPNFRSLIAPFIAPLGRDSVLRERQWSPSRPELRRGGAIPQSDRNSKTNRAALLDASVHAQRASTQVFIRTEVAFLDANSIISYQQSSRLR